MGQRAARPRSGVPSHSHDPGPDPGRGPSISLPTPCGALPSPSTKRGRQASPTASTWSCSPWPGKAPKAAPKPWSIRRPRTRPRTGGSRRDHTPARPPGLHRPPTQRADCAPASSPPDPARYIQRDGWPPRVRETAPEAHARWALQQHGRAFKQARLPGSKCPARGPRSSSTADPSSTRTENRTPCAPINGQTVSSG